ncbi:MULTISPECIES: Crp/Fnr family transcriptional regulator [unclassified Clostridium]|uniref:Crp/Fnr family transcriptional regulator n=1 Tax=unclassified Clostridium TaxID=2614128 RepID=UPI0002979587|nr:MULTISPECIES: Crp/Fnr family transcriptional regulator [unclassified Clostridium]EKQ52989.1 MAG: cAMP-binding protein [Clostridium sp. Maddingley MBC34-26]
MSSNSEALENKLKNIESLYRIYPVLEKVDKKNNGIISEQAYFKTLYADEYMESAEGTCHGILFVLEGKINIQKINLNGEQTNLYNIKEGEFCHEALSCISNFESLNIIGKAIQYSEVCIIPIEIVKQYIMSDEEFLLYIYEDLHRKFNAIIENKEEMMHESLETRLIKLLISKNSNIIYTTHSELAFQIDSAREVVSRKLKSIEKSGYIKLERGKIIIIKDLSEML